MKLFARGQRGILDGRKRFPGIKRGTKEKVKRLQGKQEGKKAGAGVKGSRRE